MPSHKYTKINLKWFKDLNIGHDTIKLLGREHSDKILFNRNHSNIFKDQSPSWQKEIKAKINKQIQFKIKSFWTAEDSQQTNTQPMWQAQTMWLTRA